jgi:F-type H+-transporting ATPase subunit b
MLDINVTLFFQVANFLILLFLLNIILYRPIRKVLGQRKDEMDSLSGLLEEFQTKSEQYGKELNENIINARKEAFQKKEEIKGEGLEQERTALQEAGSQAEGKITEARGEIKKSLVSARESLQAEVEGFSKDLAEKILGRSI